MTPEEYKTLSSFRDLIAQTVSEIGAAQSQATLGQAMSSLAPRWREVDEEFAELMEGVGAKVWQMSFAQVRPTVTAMVQHLETQLRELNAQLGRG